MHCNMQCIFMYQIAILYYCKIYRRYGYMGFQLKPDRKETENKTIRFPVPLINQIEEAIKTTDITFSGFVIQACNYALENLDPVSDE